MSYGYYIIHCLGGQANDLIRVTALFAFQFPTGSIEHFDFGHPVVDFTIDRDGRVWVSLDTGLPMSESEPSKDGQLVRVVQIDASDKASHDIQRSILTPLIYLACSGRRNIPYAGEPSSSQKFKRDMCHRRCVVVPLSSRKVTNTKFQICQTKPSIFTLT